MSVGFGFSLGDIVAAGKLARDICENCFTESQAADVKYLGFRQEIKSLADSLNRLENILKNAGSQHSRRPWHTDADHFGEALQVLPEVTGDFHKTLKDCERLLRDHARLQYGRSSAAANFSWWTSTGRDVNNLRQRVNFHITKVAFIAKPFEIQLLLEIRRELQLLRSDVAQIRGILTNGLSQAIDPSNESYLQAINIPDELTARFAAAVDVNRPPTCGTSHDWPVKEGFNALVFHFAKSTVEFNSRQRLGQNVPDGPQYLNLMKSVWAMRQVKASQSFQVMGHESLWADYMRELEAEIKGQFRRFDMHQLVRPPNEDILQLPDEYYSIWVDEEPQLRSLDLAEQRPLEEKIIEISLPQPYGTSTRQSSLTIFRKSEYEFRLVTTTKMTDNPLFHSEEGSNMNMNSTRLIPAYATPGASSTADNLALCNDRGQHEEWHSLTSPSDVAALQRALTGYRIHHDMSSFSWCLNGSREPGDSGSGRLQLWQLKPLTKAQSRVDSEPLHSTSTVISSDTLPDEVLALESAQWGRRTSNARSHSELSRTATYSTAASSGLKSNATSNTTMVSGSSITATVNGPCGDGIELVRPEVPSLVVFTKCKGRYTFLHLKLEQSVFVNPKSCSCRNPKKTCKRVVLESKKKPFVVQKLSADHEEEQGLFSWDLAMFRYPRRPDFKHVNKVDKMKYLDLEFSSIAAKDEFLKALVELENVRDVDHNNYEKYLRDRKKRAMA
ncbi:MAG: hypothetical protein Q9166_000495 [cf. Caloplaca sp. 2 TL-2023]